MTAREYADWATRTTARLKAEPTPIADLMVWVAILGMGREWLNGLRPDQQTSIFREYPI